MSSSLRRKRAPGKTGGRSRDGARALSRREWRWRRWRQRRARRRGAGSTPVARSQTGALPSYRRRPGRGLSHRTEHTADRMGGSILGTGEPCAAGSMRRLLFRSGARRRRLGRSVGTRRRSPGSHVRVIRGPAGAVDLGERAESALARRRGSGGVRRGRFLLGVAHALPRRGRRRHVYRTASAHPLTSRIMKRMRIHPLGQWRRPRLTGTASGWPRRRVLTSWMMSVIVHYPVGQ
jgi:hypothetical protein